MEHLAQQPMAETGETLKAVAAALAAAEAAAVSSSAQAATLAAAVRARVADAPHAAARATTRSAAEPAEASKEPAAPARAAAGTAARAATSAKKRTVTVLPRNPAAWIRALPLGRRCHGWCLDGSLDRTGDTRRRSIAAKPPVAQSAEQPAALAAAEAVAATKAIAGRIAQARKSKA